MSKRAPQRVLKNPRPTTKSKRAISLVKKGDYQKGRELLRPMMELKAFDISGTNLSITTPAIGPVPAILNTMINGAELFQRVGRKIYMKSVHIRGLVSALGSVNLVSDVLRILVIYDAQSNTAAPTIQAVLQDANAGAQTSGLSEINLTNRARFSILRDYQLALPSGTTNANGGFTVGTGPYDQDRSFSIDMFIKLKGLESEYNGTNGGTIADISSGALILFAVDSNNNALWQFSFTSRLRYYD